MNKDQKQPEAPRGLLAMFGGVLPKKTESGGAKAKIELEKTESSAGGGAMKRSTRKERRAVSLATRAQRPGQVVIVSASPASDEPKVVGDDITMGGTGKKQRKKRL